MSRLEDAADVYDRIEIPEELNDIVSEAIAQHPRKESSGRHTKDPVKRFPALRFTACTAAAAAVCFTVALNTSEAFAKGAGSIPFIGGIAQVLTVRSYEKTENEKNITVNIPAVEVTGESTEGGAGTEETADETKMKVLAAQQFTGDINAEIEKIVDRYVEDAKQRYDEYKEAFLATGGTEAEWAGRDMDIDVDYEVKYQQGSVISFVLTTTEAWASVYGEQYYYNLDLANNKRLTLEDILGENYVEIANKAIIEGIHQRMEENEDYVYWGYQEDEMADMVDGFKSVDENTRFYINASGNPVVAFPKYEISPGFMGVQEFEIVIGE